MGRMRRLQTFPPSAWNWEGSTLSERSGYLRGWSRLDEDFPEVSEVTSLPVSELLNVVIADHRPARAWAIVAATNASFAFL